MARKKNHTDDVFKESLRNFQAAPPVGVWNGVTESLNADRRKVRIAWISRIAAAAVIIIAAGSAWMWIQRNTQNEIGKVETGDGQEVFTEQQATSPDASTEKQHEDTQAGRTMDIGRSHIAKSANDQSGISNGNTSRENSSPDKFAQQSSAKGERLSGIYQFSIPVDPAGAGTMLAVHTDRGQSGSVREKAWGEEESFDGIDVFEEFGDEKVKDYNKWAVGGQVTPLYSYRNLQSSGMEASSASAFNSASAESYNDFESGILSYAGGVNVNYSPARRLSLQSGIYYSRQGISIANSYSRTSVDQSMSAYLPPDQLSMANSTGQISTGRQKANTVVSNIFYGGERTSEANDFLGPEDATEVKEGNVLQQFEYLEVPLIARYRVVDRRLGLNLLGGLSTNFLVGNNVYFQEGSNKESIGSTDNIKSINYSSVLGVGLQYSITRNLFVNMEPTFRYYLNSVNTNSGPGSHPYSLGFFTGISYSF